MKVYKRIFSLFLCALVALASSAQIVAPVHWSGEVVGDSIDVTATIDEGWGMAIFKIEGVEAVVEMEYYGTYRQRLAMIDGHAPSIRFNACNDMMCTAPEEWCYEDVSTNTIAPASTTQQPQGTNLWLIFLFGLLGGLLAIFTPCVWPIIPMTVSFFLKRGGGARDAIIYGLSIIVIYVGLGLLVTLLFGASALNELATNAVVNLFFFALLVVFALSFFGLFEITLPDSWSTALDGQARKTTGFLSILLMAFTLVIVSFSCTGPIIGTLLVEAAGRSLLAPTLGMLGFAIALAFPFALFAMFPTWMQNLPKSGSWMQSFKVTLAFLELALSFKFLSVADMAYGWGILPRWLFIAIWIGCFLGLGIYLIRKSWVGKVLAIISWTFTAYLIPGLWGAPVKAIAAFAPPAESTVNSLQQAVFEDYEEGLRYAREHDMPVLLNFTGYGCVNCRKMESWVLSDERVEERMNHYVVITLYVDGRQLTSDASETIGERNSRIQREQYGSNAQPYYIQLDSQGQSISSPCAFTTDPDQFLNWLLY
ncbi:MAG: thioredoxin family protein [Paludibacteraceae bacterium]|nr:thioredoxin family protein [Paludibacteraceae bacterium]